MNIPQTYADLPAPCFVRNTTSGKLFFCERDKLRNALSGQYDTVMALYGQGDVLCMWQWDLKAECNYLQVIDAPVSSINEWSSKVWAHLKPIGV